MSSKDSRPTKRHRAEEDESGTGSSTPEITRPTDLWLDDGNVVLQAEYTQFRVHRSILTRHSSVFADMFSLPQPPPESEENRAVDGIPLIFVSDRAEDLSFVLNILYDSARWVNPTYERAVLSAQVAAMGRLGRKYDIPLMLDSARAFLEHDNPMTLSAWEELDKQYGGDLIKDWNTGASARMLNLASELSFEWVLPSAFISYMVMKEDDGVEGEEAHLKMCLLNQSDPPLHPDVHAKFLMGRERFQEWLRIRKQDEIVKLFSRSHKVEVACTSKLLHILNQFDLWCPEIGHATVFCEWGRLVNPAFANPKVLELCDKCGVWIERRYEKARKDLWEALPSLFDLGSWEELKKLRRVKMGNEF